MSKKETPTVEPEGSETEVIEETETVDLVAELEKWKAMSRKTEKLAAENAAAAQELEELKKSQQTDQERLVESTKEETRRAVRLEFATKIVDAELKSALTGRVLEGGAVLEFDKSSFIDNDGNVDSASVQVWVEAHSIQADSPNPDLGQGARGNKGSLAQVRSRDELATMTPDEVLAARKDGRLDSLMGKS